MPVPNPSILDPAPGVPAPLSRIESLTPRNVKGKSAIDIKGVSYQIARELIGETVSHAKGTHRVHFYDRNGNLLLEHPWPEPGTKHVSNGRPRGAGTARPKNIRDVIHSTGTTDPPGEYRRTVRSDGRMGVRNVVYGIGKSHFGEALHVIVGETTVTFWSTRTGELIAEHPVPEPGVKHVGFVRYNRPQKTEVSTMS